jgi:hypothetical protein
VQQRYYEWIGSRRSGLRWLTAQIQKLWDIAWDMWDNRNRVLHEQEHSVAREGDSAVPLSIGKAHGRTEWADTTISELGRLTGTLETIDGVSMECLLLPPRSFLYQIMLLIRIAEERGPHIEGVRRKDCPLEYNMHKKYYHLHAWYLALTTVALPPRP